MIMNYQNISQQTVTWANTEYECFRSFSTTFKTSWNSFIHPVKHCKQLIKCQMPRRNAAGVGEEGRG